MMAATLASTLKESSSTPAALGTFTVQLRWAWTPKGYANDCNTRLGEDFLFLKFAVSGVSQEQRCLAW